MNAYKQTTVPKEVAKQLKSDISAFNLHRSIYLVHPMEKASRARHALDAAKRIEQNPYVDLFTLELGKKDMASPSPKTRLMLLSLGDAREAAREGKLLFPQFTPLTEADAFKMSRGKAKPAAVEKAEAAAAKA